MLNKAQQWEVWFVLCDGKTKAFERECKKCQLLLLSVFLFLPMRSVKKKKHISLINFLYPCFTVWNALSVQI